MAIHILYDGVDFSDAIALQKTLNNTQGLNGPAGIMTVPLPSTFTPASDDAVIVIWSDKSRGNTDLTDAASANASRLIQVAATGASAAAILPNVISITDRAAIITRLKKPPFVTPVTPPANSWFSDQRIILIMALIIAVVILLIWIAPSDNFRYANCGTSYTEGGYPIEHCEDSNY